jgi:two-component system NarL family response regulator
LPADSNGEIALSLRIAPATAKIHLANVLGKLGVSDRTHAVTIALERGILHI